MEHETPSFGPGNEAAGMVLCPALRNLLALCACECRMELLLFLCAGPDDVGSLTRRAGRSMSQVSKQLHVLLDVGLVTAREDKSRRIFSRDKRVVFSDSPGGVRFSVAGEEGWALTLTGPSARDRRESRLGVVSRASMD